MSIFKQIQSMFTPISYQSVEEYAGDSNIDLQELKASTITVINTQGKVEAIKHVNKMVSPKKPLPLPSTYRFVSKLAEIGLLRN